MKIGAFSEKYQQSQATLRYYVSLGLLIPEVKNKQFVFTKDCELDMERIMRLKESGFALKEIHEILSLYRISNFAKEEDVETLVRYWEERRDRLSEGYQVVCEKLKLLDELLGVKEKEAEAYENT